VGIGAAAAFGAAGGDDQAFRKILGRLWAAVAG